MKDYYHIRKQTTPNEAADEYVLMLNQVQSLIRLGVIHEWRQTRRKGGGQPNFMRGHKA